MKIFLIRHGETTGDVEGRFGGEYNDHLSPKGKKESEELSDKLRDKGVEIIFHSPKRRAVETALILNSALRVRLVRVKDIRERNNYGVLTGLTKQEALARYPLELEKLKGGVYRHDVLGSEGYEQFRKRIRKAFDEITNKRFGTIAIVSHGGPIRCIFREILNAGELKELGDCAVFEIDKMGNGYRIVSVDNALFEK